MAIVLILLIAFAPECIYVFAGSKYVDAVKIVPSVATSLYFIFMYQIFANVEFYYKRNKFIAYASMSGAVLNLILNYFGIKLFGYIAAGYTTLICYIIFGVAHYAFMNKICKEELNGTRLFDIKTVLGIAIGLIVFSILMIFIYPYTIIRYIILLAIFIVIVINKNIINQYLKIFKKKEK